MALDKLTSGKWIKHNGVSMLRVRRNLADLMDDERVKFIFENRDNLLDRNIQRKFPQLAEIPKRKMLFYDLELGGNESIASAALGHFVHGSDILVDCYFSADFGSERYLLSKLLRIFPQYEALITYNGNSFDVPRTKKRIVASGLVMPGGPESVPLLKEGAHHDLYLIGRESRRINLADASSGTIEKSLFPGFKRGKDIDGAKIPGAYYEFVYGRARVPKPIHTNRILWAECEDYISQQYQEVERSDPRFKELVFEYYTQNRRGPIRYEFHPGVKIDHEAAEKNMADTIEHNIHDIITLIATMTHLCT